LSHIDTMKPSSDLCFEYQQHSTHISNGVNESEEDKFLRLDSYWEHIQSAGKQREHCNTLCKTAKAKWDLCENTGSYSDIMYYCSFSTHVTPNNQALRISSQQESVEFLEYLVSHFHCKLIILLMKMMTLVKVLTLLLAFCIILLKIMLLESRKFCSTQTTA